MGRSSFSFSFDLVLDAFTKTKSLASHNMHIDRSGVEFVKGDHCSTINGTMIFNSHALHHITTLKFLLYGTELVPALKSNFLESVIIMIQGVSDCTVVEVAASLNRKFNYFLVSYLGITLRPSKLCRLGPNTTPILGL